MLTFLENFKIKNFWSKKIFFVGVEKKIDNSFDAEKAYLSIGGIFRAIRALQRDRPGKNCQNLWILPSIHVYTIASSYHKQKLDSYISLPLQTSLLHSYIQFSPVWRTLFGGTITLQQHITVFQAHHTNLMHFGYGRMTRIQYNFMLRWV